MTLRVLLIPVIAGLLTLVTGRVASAGGGEVVEVWSENDVLEATVSVEQGGHQSSVSECTWSRVFPDAGPQEGFRGTDAATRYEGGIWWDRYLRECPDGSVQVWVPQLTAEDLLGPLTDQVREQLPAPEPLLEPFDAANDWVYVQTPIDFRTSAATWEPIVATASIDGPPGASPWVTITARPAELVFSSGDPWDPGVGGRCSGAGAVAPYSADSPGACSYTYRNASSVVDGWLFPAEMAITWDVSYESSDGPGVLDMAPTVTQVPLRVAEIKALVTCTGPAPEQGGC